MRKLMLICLFLAPFSAYGQTTPTGDSIAASRTARIVELKAFIAAQNAKTAALQAQITALASQIAAARDPGYGAAQQELQMLERVSQSGRQGALVHGAAQ